MRPQVLALTAALGVLCGCRSIAPPAGKEIRTITMVGDRPRTVVAGEPGSSQTTRLPDDPAPPRGRVAGQVIDTGGRPVPGAEVRLAEDGRAAGRDVHAFTDEEGRFTLAGLRPGDSYTLIAESEDGKQVGRVRAEAPESGVKVRLATISGPRSSAVTSASDDTAESSADPVARINFDDLPKSPEFASPRTVGTTDGFESTSPGTGRTGRTSWQPSARNRTQNTDVEPDHQATSPSWPAEAAGLSASAPQTAAHSAPGETSPVPPTRELPNPLPPAREPLHEPSATPPVTQPAESRENPAISAPEEEPALDQDIGETEKRQAAGALAAAPAQASAAQPPSDDGRTNEAPLLTSPGPNSGSVHEPKQEKSPIPAPLDDPFQSAPEVSVPSMQPPGSFEASSAPFQPEATREFVPDVEAPVMLAESQPRRRRTWSELTAQRAEAKGVSAYPISVRPRASANDHIPSPVSREPDEPATEALATDAPTGPITGPVVTRCEFDQRGRRVKDFQLADLDGKPVGFRDIDADYILLDFWGSWCAPCRASIPHLVELQRQYDPKRFRVIGVAYEQGDVAEKMRQAREASQEFAINYTVLVAEQDGRPCPLQAALQVESFPTLVLMDRHGRILWRDKGANPMTMARLDKAIAAHTEPGIIRR